MEIQQDSISVRLKRLNDLINNSLVDAKSELGLNLISKESLIDTLLSLYDECNNDHLKNDGLIAKFVDKYRNAVMQLRELCINITDFETKTIIGRGRFAEVSVVKEKYSDRVLVLKRMRKWDILNSPDSIYYENEKDVMIKASCDYNARPWIPSLYYTFQSSKYIYFAMEFCSGGNLSTMLEYYKKNVPEPMLKFYMAEMIEAINSVHNIGFVHRDIRPTNLLIDKFGHLKVADFGSSAKLTKQGQVNTKLVVSVPHYVAPEIYKFQDSNVKKNYDCSCDYWSLGVVLFELTTGLLPFAKEEVQKLYLSPGNYGKKLRYPKHVSPSDDLKRIIYSLVQPAEKRMNYTALVSSDYFNDVDFNGLQFRDPPFIPSLCSSDDTSYFTTFEIQRPTPKVEDYKLTRRFTGRNLTFIGFTYMWNKINDDDDHSDVNVTKFPAAITECQNTDRSMYDCYEVEDHKSNVPTRQSVASQSESELSFHSASDMYNRMIEEQNRYSQEKERLLDAFQEKENQLVEEITKLRSENKTLKQNFLSSQEKLDKLTNNSSEESNEKFKSSEKLKNETIKRLQAEIAQLQKKSAKDEAELKSSQRALIDLSNQHTAKAAQLVKATSTIRSRSAERTKYEQETISLKSQLQEANRKLAKLEANKNKFKVDVEVKMMGTKDATKGTKNPNQDNDKRSETEDKLREQLEASKNRMEELQSKYDLLEKAFLKVSKLSCSEMCFGDGLRNEPFEVITDDAYGEPGIEKLPETPVQIHNDGVILEQLSAKEKELNEMKNLLRKAEINVAAAKEDVKELEDLEYFHRAELKEEKSIFELQLEDREEKINRLNSEVNELNRRIQELTCKNDEAEERNKLVDELEKQLRETCNITTELKMENELLQQETSKLEDRVKLLNLRVEELDEEKSLFQAKTDEQAQNIKNLNNEITQLNMCIAEKDKELMRTDEELNDIVKKFDQKIKELSCLGEGKRLLEQKIVNLEDTVKFLNGQIQELRSEKSVLLSKEMEQTKSVKNSNDELVRKNQEIDDNVKLINQLKKDIEKTRNNEKQMINQITSLEDTNKRLITQVDQLEKEKSALELKLAEAEINTKCLNKQLDSLNISVSDAKKELSCKQDEIDKCTKQINESEQERKEISGEVKKLETENRLLANRVEQLSNDLTLQEAKIECQTKTIEESTKKLERNKAKHNNKLEKEKKALDEKVKRLEDGIRLLEQKVEELETSLTAKECEVQTMKDELQEQFDISNKLREDMRVIKCKNEELLKNSINDELTMTEKEKKIRGYELKIKNLSNMLELFEHHTKDEPSENSEEHSKNKAAELEELLKQADLKSNELQSKCERLEAVLSDINDLRKEDRSPVGSEDETLSSDSVDVKILQAQVKRLESQLEKSRETAILQREAATQAKSELAKMEKEMADLKIDLRMAEREAKTAEENVKKLERSKYISNKELRDKNDALELTLIRHDDKIKQLNIKIEELNHCISVKENEIACKVEEINLKSDTINKLREEIRNIKSKNDENLKHCLKTELLLSSKDEGIRKQELKIKQLTTKLSEYEGVVKSLEEEVEKWKSNFEKVERNAKTLQNTCMMLDEQVEIFEKKIEQLNEVICNHKNEEEQFKDRLDKMSEEMKGVRKQLNEEKSLRIFAENKARLMKQELEKNENSMEISKKTVEDNLEEMRILREQLKEADNKISSLEDTLKKDNECVESMREEIVSLKQHRTELLTKIYRSEAENRELRNELNDITEDLNDLQQANESLKAALTEIETYHEVQHVKDSTTLQQHTKLIEFLQTKVHDASKSKRTFAGKLFGAKGKENLNPKELENLLYLERNKTKGLTDQLYQTQVELMMLRGENICKLSPLTSPKTTPMKSGTIPKGCTLPSCTDVGRIKHNIPHKLETKVCTKPGSRCVICKNRLNFGHKISQCKECHVWCHISCTSKLGPTCGLPQGLMENLMSVNSLKSTESASDQSVQSVCEGWVKILKPRTTEKVFIAVKGDHLLIFDKEPSANSQPREKILLDDIINVDSGTTKKSVNVEHLQEQEISCLLEITVKNVNNKQKCLYVIASNEEEKFNWMNVLKKSIQHRASSATCDLESTDPFKGKCICRIQDPSLQITQLIQLSDEVSVIGSTNGLYSLKLAENIECVQPIKIEGVGCVKKMKILSTLRLVLMICESDNRLMKCDLRMLLSDAEASECASPSVSVSLTTATALDNCLSFEVSSCNTLLAIVTANHLTIFEWGVETFDVVKYKKRIAGVQCALFTTNGLIYCTETESFCVDTSDYHERALDILNRLSSSSIKFVEPVTMIRVCDEVYLMCDRLFGTFVNSRGDRIKEREMIKWPHSASYIIYNKPFLCISHEECVTLVYVPPKECSSAEAFKFSTISFENPSMLGIAKKPVRGVYLKTEEKNKTVITFLDPMLFMKQNPKQSWSSISTQSAGDTTDAECVENVLNISTETNISINSSLLDSTT